MFIYKNIYNMDQNKYVSRKTTGYGLTIQKFRFIDKSQNKSEARGNANDIILCDLKLRSQII